ncbi:MAG: gephyrin-like molybdotransferase Glp [Anaerolineae bacterium]
MAELIEIDEALEYVLKHFHPLDAEEVDILEALDRVLAEDIYSGVDVPPFDNSAMDGYALQAADTIGASAEEPVYLRVMADLAAGYISQVRVSSGTAARIMTGAPVPAGADAVVRFEDTSEGLRRGPKPGEGTIGIFKEVKPGHNVRLAGEDIKRGSLVIPQGTTIRPQEIGVLASLGRAAVKVIRRPRVAILATGDELVDIGEEVAPGKIRNSNEYCNAALVKRYGGIPVRLGIARDSAQDLTAKIREGLQQQVDLFITSAGVSVGDYDMVKNVLAAEGEMHFWQVRIKPGKPLAFGLIQGVPLLGLPGNPVSAVVAFEVFARPAILKMLGKKWLAKPTVHAILEEEVTNSGRRHFMRAVVRKEDGRYYVTTKGSGVRVQGSGILTSLVWANSLLVVPEDVTRIEAGQEVEVQMLDWPEEVF